jgi:hypothetical protein
MRTIQGSSSYSSNVEIWALRDKVATSEGAETLEILDLYCVVHVFEQREDGTLGQLERALCETVDDARRRNGARLRGHAPLLLWPS